MAEVLSQTYGRSGRPGDVEVPHLNGLSRGDKLTVQVGLPSKGSAGGPPPELSSDEDFLEVEVVAGPVILWLVKTVRMASQELPSSFPHTFLFKDPVSGEER